MPTKTVKLAHRWFEEVWNQRKEATAHELLAPDAVCHSEVGELRGADGFPEADLPAVRVRVPGHPGDRRGDNRGEGRGGGPVDRRRNPQGDRP